MIASQNKQNTVYLNSSKDYRQKLFLSTSEETFIHASNAILRFQYWDLVEHWSITMIKHHDLKRVRILHLQTTLDKSHWILTLKHICLLNVPPEVANYVKRLLTASASNM